MNPARNAVWPTNMGPGIQTLLMVECPLHGRFSYSIERDAQRFIFNCQLFNLFLGLFYENISYNWIEIVAATTPVSGKSTFSGDSF
ncbi:hypothetical protein QQX98_006655 [Neonectria punicea]|uniref:Uncharacterized protein n=1 Tax=Neonectria punicea TaxID=979145 RepID=A0ABR1H0R3_9HYPO